MLKELFNLKGKTALITGGARGIGRAITLALAECGADVVVNFVNGEATAQETATLARAMGVNAILWQFDIGRADVAQEWLEFAKKNSLNADIFVANASLQYRAAWDKVTAEEIENQVNVNLRSTILLCQALVPYMKEQKWGRILNIGSVQQVRPHKEMCVYAATKSGLLNFVENLASQVAQFGICVNNIAPGAIATDRNKEALANPEYKKLAESKIPVGFIGDASDCAAAAVLMCSDAGRYITGANLLVDGGMGLHS